MPKPRQKWLEYHTSASHSQNCHVHKIILIYQGPQSSLKHLWIKIQYRETVFKVDYSSLLRVVTVLSKLQILIVFLHHYFILLPTGKAL